MSFDSMFDYANNPNAVRVSELQIYYQTPTLQHAMDLLTRFEIHIPYSALTKKRARQFPDPTVPLQPSQRQRRGGTPNISSFDFDMFTRVDALHDIYSGQFLPRVVIDRVLGSGIPVMNHNAIVGYCSRIVHETQVTHNLTKELHKIFGLTDKIEKGLSKGNMHADRLLYQMVARWFSQHTLHIVLDGVVDEPVIDVNGNFTPDSARSVALCAFIMVLLGAWDPNVDICIPGPMNVLMTKSIIFLTGSFQTMDIKLWNRFMMRFVNHLQKCIPIGAAVTHQPLAIPVGTTTRSGAIINSTHVDMNGVVVPFVYTPPKSHGSRKTRKIVTAVKPIPTAVDLMKEQVAKLCVSYPKKYLRDVFQLYAALDPIERSQFDPFIDTLLAINGLRDQLKVDVALSTGSLYITVDRLAMLYYALRRRDLQVVNNGFFFTAHHVGDIEIVTYKD